MFGALLLLSMLFWFSGTPGFAKELVLESTSSLLFQKCLSELVSDTQCFPDLTTTEGMAFLEKCQNCLDVELGGGNVITCAEVNAQVDEGLEACTVECGGDGCNPAFKTAFQCVFQVLVDCSTCQLLILRQVLSLAPLAPNHSNSLPHRRLPLRRRFPPCPLYKSRKLAIKQ
jgi:hypothetical protein